MSSVKLSITTLMTALAVGVAFSSLSVVLTDSAGVPQSKSLSQTDISTASPDGTSVTEVTFADVAEGDFNVVVQAFDTSGSPIGAAVNASDTVPVTPPGMAPVPVSVSITVG